MAHECAQSLTPVREQRSFCIILCYANPVQLSAMHCANPCFLLMRMLPMHPIRPSLARSAASSDRPSVKCEVNSMPAFDSVSAVPVSELWQVLPARLPHYLLQI